MLLGPSIVEVHLSGASWSTELVFHLKENFIRAKRGEEIHIRAKCGEEWCILKMSKVIIGCVARRGVAWRGVAWRSVVIQ